MTGRITALTLLLLLPAGTSFGAEPDQPSLADKAGTTVKEGVEAAGQAARHAGQAIGHGAREAATAIGHGTRKATKAIGHTSRDAVHAAGTAVRRVKDDLTGDAAEK